MPHDLSNPSAFVLGRELGQFETGSWWSAVDRLGDYGVCAITYLDDASRATLAGLQRTARGWPGLSRVLAIEERSDGTSLVAYRANLEEVHVRGRHAPLAALDALAIADQLLVEMDAMHEAGLVHAGISNAAIERKRSDYGFMSARLRGVGLAALPGRTVQDDLFELAATLDSMILGWSDEGDGVGLHGALERALGPEEARFASAAEMLAAVRQNNVRRRSGRRVKHATLPGMRKAISHRTSYADIVPDRLSD